MKVKDHSKIFPILGLHYLSMNFNIAHYNYKQPFKSATSRFLINLHLFKCEIFWIFHLPDTDIQLTYTSLNLV